MLKNTLMTASNPYSDCGCGAGWVPVVCLDPFGGSGALAVAARNLRRKAILIDISKDYCNLMVERILADK